MNKKTFVSGLLLASLLAGIASGCDNTPPGQDGNGSEPTGTGTMQRLPEEEIFAPYEETVTLTIARTAINGNNLPDGETFESNQYIQWLEESLNLKLDFTYLAPDSETYDTRLSLMTTTNDLPDISWVNTTKQYHDMVEAGLLADMTDIITQYSSERIYDYYYNSHGGRPLDYARVDGRIYAIPNASPVGHQPILWIRKDWREAVGLGEPETLEDIVALAEAFTVGDPNQSGKNDTIGLVGEKAVFSNGSGWVLNAMAAAKDAYPGSFMKDDEGRPYYGSVTDEMRETLVLLSDMYAKGWLDKEIASRDWDANAGLVASGQAGMFFYPWHGGWMASDAVRADPTIEWELYPAPVNSDGKVTVIETEPATTYLAVSSQCKNPEAVMKLLSLQYQGLRNLDEAGGKIYQGLDVNWANWPIPIELNYRDCIYKDAAAIREAAETGNTDNLPANMLNNYESYRIYLEKGTEEMDRYGNAFAFGVSALVCGDPKYQLTEAAFYGTTDTMSMKFANLQKMETETFLKIITGDADISAFDEFTKKWYSEGGSEILAEIEAEIS